jgi:hypothetical protein
VLPLESEVPCVPASDVVDESAVPLWPPVSELVVSLVLVPVLVPVLVDMPRAPVSSPELDGQYVTPCSAMIASIFSTTQAALQSAPQSVKCAACEARRCFVMSFMIRSSS